MTGFDIKVANPKCPAFLLYRVEDKLEEIDAAHAAYRAADFRDENAMRLAIQRCREAEEELYGELDIIIMLYPEYNVYMVKVAEDVFVTRKKWRHYVSKRYCKQIGIEPNYVGGDGPFIHISRGSRRSPEGYTLGSSI